MLILGQSDRLRGFVTRIGAIGPTTPAFAETMLGFKTGFLSKGYWIAVLKEPLDPKTVAFGGTTSNSGGRLGAPATTGADDQKRTKVHDHWRQQHGPRVLDAMAQSFARDRDNLSGIRRIVKIVSASHTYSGNPALDWPPGFSAPQYILTQPHLFFFAAAVTPDGFAIAADGWRGSLTADGSGPNRQRLYRYLQYA